MFASGKRYSQNNGLSTPLSKQSGMALIITLILLTMVTFMVVTSMENTALEEKMSSNFQSKSMTFQVSQSAIDRALTDLNGGDYSLLQEAVAASNGQSTQKSINIGSDDVTSQYHIVYVSEASPFGTSWDADQSSQKVESMRFEIKSEGQLSKNNKIQTKMTQGFEYH